MGFPVATKNERLDAVTYTHVSLHSGFPGTTGANELSGGGYTRQAVVVNAASGGQRLVNAQVDFSLTDATVRFFGFWDNATFLEFSANGGKTPKNFSVDPSTDTITSTSHGLSDGSKVVFFGTPPGGLSEGVVYYWRDSATHSGKVAATLGGAAINLTTGASAGCWMVEIVEDVYVGAQTHSLSAGASFVEPD